MEQGYQGWTNAATWAAALWISNDLDDYTLAVACAARYANAEELAREMSHLFRGANLRAARWAKGPVNWLEIAESFREDATEGTNNL